MGFFDFLKSKKRLERERIERECLAELGRIIARKNVKPTESYSKWKSEQRSQIRATSSKGSSNVGESVLPDIEVFRTPEVPDNFIGGIPNIDASEVNSGSSDCGSSDCSCSGGE